MFQYSRIGNPTESASKWTEIIGRPRGACRNAQRQPIIEFEPNVIAVMMAYSVCFSNAVYRVRFCFVWFRIIKCDSIFIRGQMLSSTKTTTMGVVFHSMLLCSYCNLACFFCVRLCSLHDMILQQKCRKKCSPRNTTVQFSTPYTDPERHSTLRRGQTDRQTQW